VQKYNFYTNNEVENLKLILFDVSKLKHKEVIGQFDLFYNSILINKYISNLMKNGKKESSFLLFINALNLFKKAGYFKNLSSILTLPIINIKTDKLMMPRRKGKKIVYVPKMKKEPYSYNLALK
jgi:hypothetical protein